MRETTTSTWLALTGDNAALCAERCAPQPGATVVRNGMEPDRRQKVREADPKPRKRAQTVDRRAQVREANRRYRDKVRETRAAAAEAAKSVRMSAAIFVREECARMIGDLRLRGITRNRVGIILVQFGSSRPCTEATVRRWEEGVNEPRAEQFEALKRLYAAHTTEALHEVAAS